MANRDLAASYRRAIQAFNSNDLATTVELVAPDIVYTFHGQNPVAGEYHGIDAVEAFTAVGYLWSDGKRRQTSSE
jgi:ketosteroid isomerase-like protein